MPGNCLKESIQQVEFLYDRVEVPLHYETNIILWWKNMSRRVQCDWYHPLSEEALSCIIVQQGYTELDINNK